MSENMVQDVAVFKVSPSVESLEKFADNYKAIPYGAKMSAETRAYLTACDAVNAVVKKTPSHFTTKQAKREAGEVDRSVRYGKWLATVMLNGDRWERVLADKNADLYKAIDSLVRAMTALANMLVGVFVAKYADVFRNRLEAAVRGAEKILATQQGATIEAFNQLATTVRKSVEQAETIRDSAGTQVPPEIEAAAKLIQKQAA